MNNITFGDETMGYYETVAGGSGAGSDWNGRSGIHSHMTNTRITDAEVLERRYPVILRSFSLRNGSGGHGMYRGGDGISRELLFRKTMTLSVLTERRVYAPYGLEGYSLNLESLSRLASLHFSSGGEEGAKGSNSLLRRDGVLLNLGAKCSVPVHAGVG
jgi:5-oxoprolinase (ATP-hydrolysing)